MASVQASASEPNLLSVIEVVAKEKGIEKERLVRTVEEAILTTRGDSALVRLRTALLPRGNIGA